MFERFLIVLKLMEKKHDLMFCLRPACITPKKNYYDLNKFFASYNPDEYTANGPDLVTKVSNR